MSEALVTQHPSSVQRITETMQDLKAIRTFITQEMEENIDFGTIPGTGEKKVMLLPGAQKVNMYFNARPEYTVERIEISDGHAEFFVQTNLIHRATGTVIGAGVGSCSTMESKYRFRKAERTCPECHAAAIIKGKADYGGGWLCWKKKDGCGAKFKDGDAAIESQEAGKVDNENIHDLRNTVLKMAKKRSLVDASIGLGCLTELFTQDLDDVYDMGGEEPRETPPPTPKPAATKATPPPDDTPKVRTIEDFTEGKDTQEITRLVSVKPRKKEKKEQDGTVTLKEWQEWTTEDGLTFTVWSSTQSKIAAESLDNKTPVAVTFARKGKFLNLVSIHHVDPQPPLFEGEVME